MRRSLSMSLSSLLILTRSVLLIHMKHTECAEREKWRRPISHLVFCWTRARMCVRLCGCEHAYDRWYRKFDNKNSKGIYHVKRLNAGIFIEISCVCPAAAASSCWCYSIYCWSVFFLSFVRFCWYQMLDGTIKMCAMNRMKDSFCRTRAQQTIE